MRLRRRRGNGANLAEIEALYRARLAEFRRVAAAVAGDAERGRDAVQDAFAAAVRGRSGFRGDAPLEAWLWRAVVNSARNERRKLVKHASASIPAASNGSAIEFDTGALQAALAALPERQRVALFLRYYADLDYRRIADILEISPGTVGATLTAARAALERLLEGVPDEAAR